MNEAFSQYLDKFIIVYLDDILIYSDTWEDHLDHIRKALKVLRKEKLYGNCRSAALALKKLTTSDSSSDPPVWP